MSGDLRSRVVVDTKQFAKRCMSPSLWDALSTLRTELRISSVHRGGVRQARALEQRALRLNLGCGPNLRPDWVNVDLVAGGALPLDLRRALPFSTSSCEVVYSEHFFEHLDYPEPATAHLREVLRVLEPGGTLSLGVPDGEEVLTEYVTGEGSEFEYARVMGRHPDWCATPMDQVNFSFRQRGEHKWAYDFRTLGKLLEAVGFVAVQRRAFDHSLDTETRRRGTLYVDARKPDGSGGLERVPPEAA